MTLALDSRLPLLDHVSAILRRGVIAHGIAALLVVVVGVLAALQVVPNLFALAQSVLLARYNGADDAALAIVIMLLLLNLSLLLVLMVGVVARELWAFAGLTLYLVGNVALLVLLGYTPALLALMFGGWALWRLVGGLKLLRANPVMIRELRGRMRGARAFVVISIYLALMSAFALLLYIVFGSINSLNASAATGQVGRVLFGGVVGIELLLIIFIAPSFTAGAVTGERERQTYDLVQTTLLSTPSFIIGKLESSLGYILLLLLAAIPLQSLAFLFGGISETELLLAFTILAVTAITFGTVGIYFSASQPRTLSASVRTYAMIGVWAFVIPLVGAFILNIIQSGLFGSATAVNAPAVETLLRYANLLLVSLNPFATAIQTQQLLVGQQITTLYPVTLVSDGSTIPMLSPWIVLAIVYLAIAAILIVLTIRRTRTIDQEA
jgi:ABC-2 type transport system permease protein